MARGAAQHQKELFRISTPMTLERLNRAIAFARDDAEGDVDDEEIRVRHYNGQLIFSVEQQPQLAAVEDGE